MSCNLSPEELILAASVLSIYISRNRTLDEINLLGNFFQAIGTNLSTIAAAAPQDQPNTNNENDNNGSNTNNENNNSEKNSTFK